MELPFGRTREMEAQVDAFLDVVAQGMLALQSGVSAYIADNSDAFQRHIEVVSRLEHRADELSRDVERVLYAWSLIPESRGDVLEVMEHTDTLVDVAKGLLHRFDTERPTIPEEFCRGYLELSEASVQASDHMVRAARSYFRDPRRVKDDVHKVYYYESQADDAGRRLKRAIFRSGLDLAHKLHLRYFADQTEALSDHAQDGAAMILIATAKREV